MGRGRNMVERYLVLKDSNEEDILTLSTQEPEYDILFYFLVVNIHMIRDVDSSNILPRKPFDTEVVRLRVSKDEFLEEYEKHKIGLQMKGIIW